MKKIILFIGFIFIAYSCDKFENTASILEFVQWESSSMSIDEDATEPITIEVQLVGAHRNASTEVVFEVTETNVREGVDYTFPNGKTLVIDANASTASIMIEVINNDDFNPEDRNLKLNLVSAGNNLSVGDPTSVNKVVTVAFVDDDCFIPSLVGTYNVETTDTNPAGCAGVTNVVELVALSQFVYSITDITGGLYLNCYGSADNPAEFTVSCSGITVTDQPDVVYGSDVFNGTGTIEDNGSFTIIWSNGFGDAGTSVYTK